MMFMARQILIIILSSFLSFNCISLNKISNEANVISKFSWLEGTWIQKNGSTILKEEWHIEHTNLISGKSYYIKNQDTLFTEKIKIKSLKQEDETAIYYSVVVSNQNEGKEILFKYTPSKDKELFIFENKNHDFPQKIVYTKPKNDTLKVSIDGYQNDKYNKINFVFIRQ